MEKIKRTFGFMFSHPLSRKHPLRSVMRFIAWQFQCTLSPHRFFIKAFIKPLKFYSRKGLAGATGNIYCGLHEFSEMSFLLHFLRPEDAFFDIGANIGAFSLLASGLCGSKIIALEPAPPAFNILEKNIKLNRLAGKLTAVNAAAGGSKGILSFISDEDTTNHVIASDEKHRNSMEVPVITVDSLLTEALPALIKIDVEGFETEVLKGMDKTLNARSLKAIIIELNGSGGRYGYDEEDIHQLILSKGFAPYDYEPFARQLKCRAGKGNFNTIYCRDMAFITERLEAALKIHVMGEQI
ncbi:MAG TPA: FkbM family methyltransferase [Mucilaginibacter sp.]|jgi:FkbM family methyltransferase|nr:FkbM family methyltransferase [Mucilaginibacter sp.]